MHQAHSTLTARLSSWIHAGHGHKVVSYDSSPYNHQDARHLDGACPACDHPFGGSNHICIGSATGMVS